MVGTRLAAAAAGTLLAAAVAGTRLAGALAAGTAAAPCSNRCKALAAALAAEPAAHTALAVRIGSGKKAAAAAVDMRAAWVAAARTTLGGLAVVCPLRREAAPERVAGQPERVPGRWELSWGCIGTCGSVGELMVRREPLTDIRCLEAWQLGGTCGSG